MSPWWRFVYVSQWWNIVFVVEFDSTRFEFLAINNELRSKLVNNQRTIKKWKLGDFSMWVVKVFLRFTNCQLVIDASGKQNPGFLKGSINSLGDYDQCLAINNQELDLVGQYCTVSFTMETENDVIGIKNQVLEHLNRSIPVARFYEIMSGLCLPANCNQDDVKQLAKSSLKGLPIKMTAILNCDTRESISFDFWKLSRNQLIALWVDCHLTLRLPCPASVNVWIVLIVFIRTFVTSLITFVIIATTNEVVFVILEKFQSELSPFLPITIKNLFLKNRFPEFSIYSNSLKLFMTSSKPRSAIIDNIKVPLYMFGVGIHSVACIISIIAPTYISD